MTAINIIHYADSVCLLTDGAIYQPDGTMDCTTDKVATLAHCNAVMTSRGPALLLPLIAARMGTLCDSFDQLVEMLPWGAAQAFGRHKDWFKDGADTAFDLFVAGWSESRDRAESYALFSHAGYGTETWTVYPLDRLVMVPSSEALSAEFDQPGRPIDAEVDGLRILETQRGMVCEHPGGQSHHGVGGFAQLTTVWREGISTKILKRWPDRVGEPLGSIAA